MVDELQLVIPGLPVGMNFLSILDCYLMVIATMDFLVQFSTFEKLFRSMMPITSISLMMKSSIQTELCEILRTKRYILELSSVPGPFVVTLAILFLHVPPSINRVDTDMAGCRLGSDRRTGLIRCTTV